MKTNAQEKKHKLEVARQKAKAWAIKQKIKSKEKKYNIENQTKGNPKVQTKKEIKYIPSVDTKSDHTYKIAYTKLPSVDTKVDSTFKLAHIKTLQTTLQNLTKERNSLDKTISLINKRLEEVKSEDSVDQPL